MVLNILTVNFLFTWAFSFIGRFIYKLAIVFVYLQTCHPIPKSTRIVFRSCGPKVLLSMCSFYNWAKLIFDKQLERYTRNFFSNICVALIVLLSSE